MSNRGGWTRRLDKLQTALPNPPAGSPYWHDSFARLGHALRVGDREPDYAAAIRAYGGLRPPYGDEAERLHEHLCELVGRAADKIRGYAVDLGLRLFSLLVSLQHE